MRPYRAWTSNALLQLCMVGLTMQVILVQCVVAGYEQSLFIDRYFFTLTLILQYFDWGAIFLLLLFCFLSRQKWPITRRVAMKMTESQDLAIYLIKKARAFQIEIDDKKTLNNRDKILLSSLIEDLNMQFNTLRGREPMIMDALLETIDSMRLMQKK